MHESMNDTMMNDTMMNDTMMNDTMMNMTMNGTVAANDTIEEPASDDGRRRLRLLVRTILLAWRAGSRQDTRQTEFSRMHKDIQTGKLNHSC